MLRTKTLLDMWLVEDPIPIVLLGLAAEAILAVILVQTGRGATLIAMVGVLLVTLALLVVERLVVTQVEQVEQTLYDVAAALKTNDIPRIVQHISPASPEMRDEARRRLAEVVVREAKIGRNLRIEINDESTPRTATATFLGRFDVKDYQGTNPYDTIVRRFTVHLAEENGHWLLTDYDEQSTR